LPIFTTLDVWNTLSQYLRPALVLQKYKTDNRAILFKGKNKKLIGNLDDDNDLFDAYAIDATAIIEFVLECVKKDPQIAGIIVRSVAFIDVMLKCIAFVMKNCNKQIDTFLYTGLTLLHFLLSYSEEDVFEVILG